MNTDKHGFMTTSDVVAWMTARALELRFEGRNTNLLHGICLEVFTKDGRSLKTTSGNWKSTTEEWLAQWLGNIQKALQLPENPK